jgi:chorismate mutase
MAGRADLVPEVASISLDLLYDGWMIEVHVDPAHAKSDAAQQLAPEDLGAMLTTLRPRRRAPESADARDRIEGLRHQLDELDAQILNAVAARMEIVRKIAAIQKAHGVAVFQPDRWKATLEKYRQAGLARGLPPEFLESLYELLHEEALRQKTEAQPDQLP